MRVLPHPKRDESRSLDKSGTYNAHPYAALCCETAQSTLMKNWHSGSVLLLLYHNLPILQKQLIVHPHFTGLAQVAHHVPVQRGLVHAARFRITITQGQMHRAAHFFVEEHAARAAIHARIISEGEFAEIARSRVDFKHVLQVHLPDARTGLDYLAVAEVQAHSLDGATIERGRNIESNNAIRALLQRTREEFAAGAISFPVTVDEDAVFNGQCQVRPCFLVANWFWSQEQVVRGRYGGGEMKWAVGA